MAVDADRVWIGFGYNGKEELSDLWHFELLSKSWHRVKASGDLPTARSVTDLVLLNGDSDHPTLFIFGGEFTPSKQGHEGAGEYHADAYILDIKSMKWTRVPAVSIECTSHPTATPCSFLTDQGCCCSDDVLPELHVSLRAWMVHLACGSFGWCDRVRWL
jgi:hypothetical protein